MRPIAFTTVRLKAGPLVQRLVAIHHKIDEWIETYQPQAAAIEEIFVRNNNAKSALVLGQARGAALLAMGQHDLDPMGYAPATIKKAVAGHGRADVPLG